MSTATFIIDCPICRAKVAAVQKGSATAQGREEESGEAYGSSVYLGQCPACGELLVGASQQIDFGGIDADEDRWAPVIRVYPKPNKSFASYNIPKVVTASLAEASRCMQVESYVAACAMIGRAIEGVCRHALNPKEFEPAAAGVTPPAKSKIMLAEGIQKLKDAGIIDSRIHEWGTQLHAFRNLAAHPDDFVIDRDDAEDLFNFATAMVEYIYDLAERYAEFQQRQAHKKSRTRSYNE